MPTTIRLQYLTASGAPDPSTNVSFVVKQGEDLPEFPFAVEKDAEIFAFIFDEIFRNPQGNGHLHPAIKIERKEKGTEIVILWVENEKTWVVFFFDVVPDNEGYSTVRTAIPSRSQIYGLNDQLKKIVAQYAGNVNKLAQVYELRGIEIP